MLVPYHRIKSLLFVDAPALFLIFLMFCHSEALRLVVETAKPGVSVLSLCEKGDAYIMAETGKVFKKEKEMKKGEVVIIQVHHLCISVGPFNKQQDSIMQAVSVQLYTGLITLRYPPSLYFFFFANAVDGFQIKTWWFSFSSSRHCLSYQRLSQ